MKRQWIAAGLAVATAFIALPGAALAHHPIGLSAGTDGLVWDELAPGIPGTACAGLLEVLGTGLCTHGPDATSAMTAQALGDDGGEPTSAAPFCSGDGVSGARVQAVYAYPAGSPNRLAELRPQIVGMAGIVDEAFDDSAALTGGSSHVRWAMSAGTCSLSVLGVEVSAAAATSFRTMLTDFRARGLLARSDRKYLVWMDAGTYCGIATFRRDDDPDPAANINDGAGAYESGVARIDRSCWDDHRPDESNHAAQHELIHLLGGVQGSAPHASGYGHCFDEWDALCYDDGTISALTIACPGEDVLDGKLDCNGDDYFSADPAPGSYLATHWNVYDSSFLIPSDTPEPGTPAPAEPEPELAPAPPQTRRLAGPRRRITATAATFRFESVPGASFECRLDREPYEPCASPVKLRGLSSGRHAFRVRAISPSGAADPTPARWRFRVVGG